MNIRRRLTADVPGELLAAHLATSRMPETSTAAWIETPQTYDDVFTTLAVLEANSGVLTDATPGLLAPATPEGGLL